MKRIAWKGGEGANAGTSPRPAEPTAGAESWHQAGWFKGRRRTFKGRRAIFGWNAIHEAGGLVAVTSLPTASRPEPGLLSAEASARAQKLSREGESPANALGSARAPFRRPEGSDLRGPRPLRTGAEHPRAAAPRLAGSLARVSLLLVYTYNGREKQQVEYMIRISVARGSRPSRWSVAPSANHKHQAAREVSGSTSTCVVRYSTAPASVLPSSTPRVALDGFAPVTPLRLRLSVSTSFRP